MGLAGIRIGDIIAKQLRTKSSMWWCFPNRTEYWYYTPFHTVPYRTHTVSILCTTKLIYIHNLSLSTELRLCLWCILDDLDLMEWYAKWIIYNRRYTRWFLCIKTKFRINYEPWSCKLWNCINMPFIHLFAKVIEVNSFVRKSNWSECAFNVNDNFQQKEEILYILVAEVNICFDLNMMSLICAVDY